jgi:hypothetical protein
MGIRKRSKTFENIQKYSKNEWKRLHSTGENIRRMIDFWQPLRHKGTKGTKKRPKMAKILATLFSIEIRTISPIISLKCAELGAVMLRRKR